MENFYTADRRCTGHRRDTPETRDRRANIVNHLPHICAEGSAFSYHSLKSLLLCKLLVAITLLLNHFPTALMHCRESIIILWDVAIAGTNTTGACSSQANSNTQAPSPAAVLQTRNARPLLQHCHPAPKPCTVMEMVLLTHVVR